MCKIKMMSLYVASIAYMFSYSVSCSGEDIPDWLVEAKKEVEKTAEIKNLLKAENDNYGDSLPESQLEKLIKAIESSDVLAIKNSSNIKHYVNDRDSTGYGLLHYAAISNQPEIIKLLINNGADPEITTPYGLTPLFLAVRNESSEAVHELLRSNNVDVNRLFHLVGAKSVLMVAVGLGSVDTVRILLEAGADPNLQTSGGWTAFHFLAITPKFGEESTRIGSLIISAGGDVNLWGKEGIKVSPLHFAIMYGSLEAVLFFLKNSADFQMNSDNGFAALKDSILGNKLPVVDALIKAGAHLNAVDSSGKTVYDYFIEKANNDSFFSSESKKLMRYLLDNGAVSSVKK